MKRIVIALIFLLLPVIVFAADKEAGSMIENIHKLSHDTFRIVGNGVVIYTDPFQVKKADRADLILITHEHRDHCSTDDVDKIASAETEIVAPPDCAAKLMGRKVTFVKPGDRIKVKGIEIEAVPAYNTNKKFHPRDKAWVGYIFTVAGTRIYHAGDTDYIPEMKGYKCDVALLPVSGTYVMTAEEAVQAAIDINPKVAIPMHYGAIIGSREDAEKFAGALKGKIKATILPEE